MPELLLDQLPRREPADCPDPMSHVHVLASDHRRSKHIHIASGAGMLCSLAWTLYK